MDIVIFEPKIPQNTGSIARTCAATKTPLHLIEPVGFEISDRTVRRAGLDYWPHVDLTIHADWNEYLKKRNPKQIWLISKFAERLYCNAQFSLDDAIVFGNEVSGLSSELKSQYLKQMLRIPMVCPEVRSLNLSNAVSIVLYEARRQLGLDL